MVHQFVIGRTEQGVTSKAAKASTVDDALRMLDAKANGKRFGL
jgi:hypothetical protein